jgi:hypothetical protein
MLNVYETYNTKTLEKNELSDKKITIKVTKYSIGNS